MSRDDVTLRTHPEVHRRKTPSNLFIHVSGADRGAAHHSGNRAFRISSLWCPESERGPAPPPSTVPRGVVLVPLTRTESRAAQRAPSSPAFARTLQLRTLQLRTLQL